MSKAILFLCGYLTITFNLSYYMMSFFKLLNQNDDLNCSYLYSLSEIYFLLGPILFQNDKLNRFTTNIYGNKTCR